MRNRSEFIVSITGLLMKRQLRFYHLSCDRFFFPQECTASIIFFHFFIGINKTINPFIRIYDDVTSTHAFFNYAEKVASNQTRYFCRLMKNDSGG